MTARHRISQIFNGLLTIMCALFIIVGGNNSYIFILLIFGLTFTITGIRYLNYYLKMARHMVSGKIILYIGIIYLDFGLFSLTLHNASLIYVVLYLIVIYAFSGLVDILRGLEARRFHVSSWRLKCTTGFISVILAFAAFFCGVFLHSPNIVAFLYATGLIYSGTISIITAFRKTDFVFIQ